MLKERILETIQEMDAHDLISLHNEYCEAVNACDDYIYSMEDLDMLCDGRDAEWIIARAIFGDYNAFDDYIMFNGYGNFQTMNEYNVCRFIYADDIADYIARENDSLYNDDIQEILDEHDAIEQRAEREANHNV